MSLEVMAINGAHALRDLGQALYMGPMLAFTAILFGVRVAPYVRTEDAVRVYRAWGPGFGFSLGAWVLGMLATRYLETGAFTWPLGSTAQILDTAGWLAFFLLWANNCRLEVWTLDPVRKLDKTDEGVVDRPAYEAAVRRLMGVMGLQSGLLVLSWVLWRVAAAMAA